jgi:hypothetical protein
MTNAQIIGSTGQQLASWLEGGLGIGRGQGGGLGMVASHYGEGLSNCKETTRKDFRFWK